MKTVKYLSDGTIAKVGMIVYHIYSNSIGRITHIKTKHIRNEIYLPDSETVFVKTTEKGNGWSYFRPDITEKHIYLWLLSSLRKATPKEIKQYNLTLKNQNNE